MITPLESRVLDANSEALGVSVKELMGNAGAAVAAFLEENYPGKSYVFVCGTGNNGGDGFAAALKLDPSRCTVALLKKASNIRTDAARDYYSVLECDIVQYSKEVLSRGDVIVDCALGTGISGEVKDPYLTFINDANSCGKPIVSVDVPSGFGTTAAIEPGEVVTFHDRKEGMEGAPYRVIVAGIGIPEDAWRAVGPGDMLRYPVPDSGSHKGANGRLLAICGGPYFGAPALACRAAMRAGADLVHLCCPQSAFSIAASACPEITGTMLPGTRLTAESVDMLLELSERYDAVLVGPGLGSAVDTLEAVRQFISRCRKPMVIDADAIAVAASMELPNAILTPHAGEFKALEGPLEAVAGRYGAVLLKGKEDRISDGSRTRVNRTGNAGMTCGGTGDVLAGCAAALLSKGMCQFDAACLAAYICGSAGDRAFADKSYGLIASDVIEEIPHVLRDGLR